MLGNFALAAAVIAVALAFANRMVAEEKKANLSVGDAAPSFESTDDQGKPWKSADHFGKKIVVVYFYPADMTGGCTKQACGFRDDMKTLTDKGIEVIGVSGDSVKNHQFFKKFYDLNFTLLADEKGDLAKKFGVPFKDGGVVKSKDKDGNDVELKRGVTTERWTFVIGKDGKIAVKEDKVAPAEDSKKILDAVEKLK
jgi:peroxiredoxin Q/BCP